MFNIKAVAKKANVSISTVSRVMNGTARVTEKTKKRVMEAIEELEYKPNTLARNFRMKQSRTIITMLNDIRNPVFAEFVRGFEDVAFENDYQLLIGNTDYSDERAMKYIDLLKTQRADGGILITPRINPEMLKELKEIVPIVLVNDYVDDFSIPTVKINNKQASYDITQHLIHQGHVDIGYIGGNFNTNIASDRRKGFEEAFKDNNLKLDNSWIMEVEHTSEGGYQGMEDFFSLERRPTALACYNDEVAIGAFHYASDHGVLIPEEISIVGIDDISTASIIKPKLTTVYHPKYEMGRLAMTILLSMIRGEEVLNKRNIVQHKLILRESVRLRKE